MDSIEIIDVSDHPSSSEITNEVIEMYVPY